MKGEPHFPSTLSRIALMTTEKIPGNITANEPAPALSAPLPDVEVDVCPDGGFGWVQVGVGFTINAFTWGQTAVRNPVSRVQNIDL